VYECLVIEACPVGPMPIETTWLSDAPLQPPRRWGRWIGPMVSVAMLVAATSKMRIIDVRHIWSILPSSLSFWAAMAGAYLALPISEWMIYRGLWRLPASGIIPLLRKRISNEIVVGYSGEIYFYAWARRNAPLVAKPFGAIKDVSILSAQVGNIVTLAMLVLAWPSLGLLGLGVHGREMLYSCGAVVAMSLPVMLFRKHLFTLSSADLRRIAALHIVRVVATMGLTAIAWHKAEPGVALTWWLVLVALRQLLSRLPLLPNKDIAFATVALFLIGDHINLVTMVAMTSSVILCTHLMLGAVLAITDLMARDRKAV
jgi:hypothetical protein